MSVLVAQPVAIANFPQPTHHYTCEPRRPSYLLRSKSAPVCPALHVSLAQYRASSDMDAIRSVRDPAVQDCIHRKPAYKVYHPSPASWQDQFLYFFLPDRFSDGNEAGYKDLHGRPVTSGKTLLFQEHDRDNALKSAKDKKEWLDSGMKFVGGTIRGAITKLGYLKRMGVTAVWMGPIFKQVARDETYHGYAIQDFLEVDPRFGTKKDLQQFVAAAHRQGIYVLLDIVLNHAGDVFAYHEPGQPYTGMQFPVKGFWNGRRDGFLPLGPVDEAKSPGQFPDGAVWPRELQANDAFFQKGFMAHMDGDPPEINEADFFELKSLNLGSYEIADFEATPTLRTLCEIYKFWIAYADIDGYRIDTVRHMGKGATKYFATEIHNYARSIGKANFMMVGEISGEGAYDMVNSTGLNAALAIDDLQKSLFDLPQGLANPADYFDQFQKVGAASVGPQEMIQSWQGSQLCNMIEDHDQTWRHDIKGRFCAEKNGPLMIHAAIGLNMCTLGIPCLMSGTEQNFDGNSKNYIGMSMSYADRFIRESMFGGSFGAFGTKDRHFFNEETVTYNTVRQIASIRRRESALRRGGQILRETSRDGIQFQVPKLEQGRNTSKLEDVVAWSRIDEGSEILCMFSTHLTRSIEVWIRVGDDLSSEMECIYPPGMLDTVPIAKGPAGTAVCVTVPPHSFMMFKQKKR